MRYLTDPQLRTALSLAKSVVQWLPPRVEGEHIILRWTSIEPSKGKFNVRHCEVYRDPQLHDFDVFELDGIDPDEPEGTVTQHASSEDALRFAATLGATPDRYLNLSMLPTEYEAYWRG